MASSLMKRNWVEKYRPDTLKNVILPTGFKAELQNYVDHPEIMPHMIFYSNSPGTGKTSTAKAIIKDLKSRHLFINASLNANKKTIENQIAGFADCNDRDKRPKIVLLDEVDGSSESQFQDPMKAAIETYDSTVVFIMTANDINSLTDPILSRLTPFCFDFSESSDVKQIKTQMMARLGNICKNENVKIDRETAEFLVSKYYPDFRYVVKIAERLHRRFGSINISEIKSTVDNDLIFKSVIDGDWLTARNLCIDGISNKAETFKIFEDSYLPLIDDPIKMIKSAKVIGDYMANHTNVIDKEINIATMLANLIMINKDMM